MDPCLENDLNTLHEASILSNEKQYAEALSLYRSGLTSAYSKIMNNRDITDTLLPKLQEAMDQAFTTKSHLRRTQVREMNTTLGEECSRTRVNDSAPSCSSLDSQAAVSGISQSPSCLNIASEYSSAETATTRDHTPGTRPVNSASNSHHLDEHKFRLSSCKSSNDPENLDFSSKTNNKPVTNDQTARIPTEDTDNKLVSTEDELILHDDIELLYKTLIHVERFDLPGLLKGYTSSQSDPMKQSNNILSLECQKDIYIAREIRERICELIVLPCLFPSLFVSFNATVLLIGMNDNYLFELVKKAASDTSAWVRTLDLEAMLACPTEQISHLIREVFTMCYLSVPAILHMKNLTILSPQTEVSCSQKRDKMLAIRSELLHQLHRRRPVKFRVVCCCTRPWLLGSSLRRRYSHQVIAQMPLKQETSLNTLQEVFHELDVPHDNLDLPQLADLLEGYSKQDAINFVSAAIKRCHLTKLSNSEENDIAETSLECLVQYILEEAMALDKCYTKKEVEKLEKYVQDYGLDAQLYI